MHAHATRTRKVRRWDGIDPRNCNLLPQNNIIYRCTIKQFPMASSIRQPSTPALFFLLLLVCCCCQFRISNSAPSWTSAKKIFARGLLSLPLTFGAGIVHADDLNAPTYYFGVGCFWHVQHEFVQAEQSILNRPNTQVTASQLFIELLNSIVT